MTNPDDELGVHHDQLLAMMSPAELDQQLAQFTDIVRDMIKMARTHNEVCTQPGCPGVGVLTALAHLVQKGPSMSLTALGLMVSLMAEGKDLLAEDELEVMLSGVADEPGGSTPDAS